MQVTSIESRGPPDEGWLAATIPGFVKKELNIWSLYMYMFLKIAKVPSV